MGRDIAHAKLKELITPVKNCRSTSKITRSTTRVRENPCRLSIRFTWPNHRRSYDSYVDLLQSHGGSMIMLAKGTAVSRLPTRVINTAASTSVARRSGGGTGAAEHQASGMRRYPELGMEAIWKIEVEDFPAFSWSMTKVTTSSSKSSTNSARLH